MPRNSLKLSNKAQREYTRVKGKIEWIIEVANSYEEAFNKISKIKHMGETLSAKMINSILTHKETLNQNPDLKRKKISKKGSKRFTKS